MRNLTFTRLLGFTLFFLAQWFFGNLYEEIVLAPNQLVNTYDALRAWQGYFTLTNQIYYYVPFTQLSVGVIWWLYGATRLPIEKRRLRKAGVYGLLAVALTAIIVTQLNIKLFFGNLDGNRSSLHLLSILWLIGNAVRLVLVGVSMWNVLAVFSQRLSASDARLA